MLSKVYTCHQEIILKIIFILASCSGLLQFDTACSKGSDIPSNLMVHQH